MTKDDILNVCNQGGDMEFAVSGHGFTLLAWTDQGIVIGEHGTENEWNFKDGKDVLEHFLINDIPLEKQLNEAEIIFSS